MNSPDTNTLRLWREAAADYTRMADLALCDEARLELLYWSDVFTDLVETAKFENTAPHATEEISVEGRSDTPLAATWRQPSVR